MFYGHIYTIVTVHSIKDCLDQPLHHSHVILAFFFSPEKKIPYVVTRDVRPSVRPSICHSRKKLLTTVLILNINLPSRLISNSFRISDRANVCFLISACVLLC